MNIKLVKMIQEYEKKYNEDYFVYSLILDDFYYLSSSDDMNYLFKEVYDLSKCDTVDKCGHYLFSDNIFYENEEPDIEIYEIILEIEVENLEDLKEKILEMVPEEFL